MLNVEGKMVVGQFGSFIGPFLSAYDAEIEGYHSHQRPYLCNGGVSPASWVSWCRSSEWPSYRMVHVHVYIDNGGMVPGSIPIEATTIFQEGIRIPPTKLYKKGVLQEDLLELILHNVRTPQWNRFGLNALVAACNTAAKRVVELAERFGDDVLYSTMDTMLQRNHDTETRLLVCSFPRSLESSRLHLR